MNRKVKLTYVNFAISDDGYYWDNNLEFNYQGNTYCYSEVGSGSGWIKEGYYFSRGPLKRLYGDDINRSESLNRISEFRYVNEDKLLKLVNLLDEEQIDSISWEEGIEENKLYEILMG